MQPVRVVAAILLNAVGWEPWYFDYYGCFGRDAAKLYAEDWDT